MSEPINITIFHVIKSPFDKGNSELAAVMLLLSVWLVAL